MPLGFGALAAAVVAGGVVAQGVSAPGPGPQPPQGGLRHTLDTDPATGRDPRTTRTQRSPARAQPSPAGEIPRYGTPPGAGAGTTGFVSTNVPRRRGAALPGSDRPPAADAAAPTVASSPAAARPAAAAMSRTPYRAGAGPAARSGTAAPASPRTPAARGRAVAEQPGAAPNAAAIAAAARRRAAAAEDDPYAPIGIRTGAFVLRPSIEVMGGYDSNAPRTSSGRGSALVTVTPELTVRSDWQRHSFGADIRSSYTAYRATPELDRPTLDAKMNGRIDVSRHTRVDLEGRVLVGTDNPGSPNLQAGLARLPIYTTVGGTAGVTQRFNRVEVGLKGSIDRTVYGASSLTDGTASSNADRNYNQYGTALRGSYELTPGVKPFVEVGFDNRVHDSETDASGLRRDSRGFSAKAGTSFELTRKLTGEFAVGHVTRTYADPTLADLRGMIVDGSLVWTVSALTAVKLNARSTAEESTQAGVSGALKRDVDLQVEHAFRRWLIGTAKLGYGLDTYQGSGREDQRYTASAALTYKLTRTVAVKGEFRQEWLRSNLPGNDYTASIAMLGIRLQR